MLRHLHLLPPGQTTCSSLSDRQRTCRKAQVRDLLCLTFPHVSTSFSPICPYCRTAELLAIDSEMLRTSQFPSQSWPSIATSPAKLFGNWEHYAVCFSTAFLCCEESPSGWPESVDRRGSLFHQADCCPALDLYSEL